MKTKLISLILCFVALITLIPAATVSSAATPTEDFSATEYEYAEDISVAVGEFSSSYTFSAGISTDSLSRIMHILRYEYPLLFCLDSSYSYSYYIGGDGSRMAKTVSFDYTMTEDEYIIALDEVNRWTDAVTSLADPSFTELEYALFFHDYLCANYEYDTTYGIHDPYNFIKSKKGVCESYTNAYTLLLEKVGVSTSFALSKDMGHVWNIVQIGGEWYHADVTWGDPVGIVPGMAYHTYFLKSDDYFLSQENDHYSWLTAYVCDSTLYDASAIGDAASAFAFADDNWYYIYDRDLYSTDSLDKEGTLCLDLNLIWFVWDNPYSYYIGNYAGLVVYDDCIYISSPTEILKYDTSDGSLTEIYSYEDGDGYIYGFTMDLGDDGITYADYSSGYADLTIATEPEDNLKTVSVQIFEVKVSLPGDTNDDGNLSTTDLSYMLRSIANGSPMAGNGDLNGDGKISTADISHLRRIFSGGSM